MSAEVAKLFVSIGADISDLSKKLDTASGDLKKSFLPGLVGAELIADGLKAVGSGMVDFVRGAIDHLGELQALTAQTEAVIKSTGGVAGVTAEQVTGLADAIEATTGISGEMIQAGENLLLTFTNIKNGAGAGNDIFNQTTRLMVDMSKAMGTDAKGAAIMLGKALNDPVQGISALTRVGVSFTEGQKATIKALQESGDLMGAQKIILAELNREFGGSAEAYGRTFPGAVGRLSEAWEGLGDALIGAKGPMTVITNGTGMLADGIKQVADTISSSGIIGAFNKLLGPEMKAAILGVAGAVTIAMVPAMGAAVAAIGAAVVAAGPFIIAAGGIAAGAYLILKNWDSISGAWNSVLKGMGSAIGWLADVAKSVIEGVSRIFMSGIKTLLGPWLEAFELLPDQVKGPIKALAANIGAGVAKVPGIVLPAFKGAASAVGGVVSEMGVGFQSVFNQLSRDIPKAIDKAGTAGAGSMAAAGKAISKEAQAAADAAKKAAEEIAKAFNEIPGKMSAVIAKAGLFGEEMEVSARQASLLRSSIEGLIDKGVSPADQRVQALVTTWQKYDKAAKAVKATQDDLARASVTVGSVMEDVWGELDKASKKAALLGKDFDLAGEQTRILNDAMKKVADVGGPGAAEAVSTLRESLEAARSAQDGLTRSVEGFKRTATDMLAAINGLKEGLGTMAQTLGIDTNNAFVAGAEKAGKFVFALGQVGAALPAVVDGMPGLLDSMSKLGGEVGEVVGPMLLTLGTTLTTTVIPALLTMGGAVSAALGPFGLIAVGIAAAVAAGLWLYENWDMVAAKLKAIWDGVGAAFRGAFEWMGGFVRGVFDGVVAAIKAPINAIIGLINMFIRGLNRIRFEAPSWVPGMGGKSWGINIPQIPMLAKGGIANGAMQAIIGEAGPEAVVPLRPDVLRGIGEGISGQMGGGGATQVVINMQVNGTARDTAKAIVGELYALGIRP